MEDESDSFPIFDPVPNAKATIDVTSGGRKEGREGRITGGWRNSSRASGRQVGFSSALIAWTGE